MSGDRSRLVYLKSLYNELLCMKKELNAILRCILIKEREMKDLDIKSYANLIQILRMRNRDDADRIMRNTLQGNKTFIINKEDTKLEWIIHLMKDKKMSLRQISLRYRQNSNKYLKNMKNNSIPFIKLNFNEKQKNHMDLVQSRRLGHKKNSYVNERCFYRYILSPSNSIVHEADHNYSIRSVQNENSAQQRTLFENKNIQISQKTLKCEEVQNLHQKNNCPQNENIKAINHQKSHQTGSECVFDAYDYAMADNSNHSQMYSTEYEHNKNNLPDTDLNFFKQCFQEPLYSNASSWLNVHEWTCTELADIALGQKLVETYTNTCDNHYKSQLYRFYGLVIGTRTSKQVRDKLRSKKY